MAALGRAVLRSAWRERAAERNCCEGQRRGGLNSATFSPSCRRLQIAGFGKRPEIASIEELRQSFKLTVRGMAENAGVKPDMDEAYGSDYATRSSEEGMGQRYGDAVESGDSTQQLRQPSNAVATETKEGYTTDMSDSYGEAYATRSTDEGFGQIYGEAAVGGAIGRVGNAPPEWTEDAHKVDEPTDFPRARDYERGEQGEPVAQKEHGRHAEAGVASSGEAPRDRDSQSGVST